MQVAFLAEESPDLAADVQLFEHFDGMLCRLHFQLKKAVIEQQMQDWLASADKNHKKLVQDAVSAIGKELDKLC